MCDVDVLPATAPVMSDLNADAINPDDVVMDEQVKPRRIKRTRTRSLEFSIVGDVDLSGAAIKKRCGRPTRAAEKT